MNISALFSNAIFLAITFLPALYLNEFVQSQSTAFQLCYCVVFIAAVIGIDAVSGRHLLGTSYKHPLITVFLPVWFFFSINKDWTSGFLLGMKQFYVLNHCAMFVGLRMIADWSKGKSQAPEWLLDYVWMILLSLPFAAIAIAWHFSNSPVRIYTSSLIATSAIYYIASCMGCLLFASATIYHSSLLGRVPPVNKQQMKEEFEQMQSLTEEERKRINEHLEQN